MKGSNGYGQKDVFSQVSFFFPLVGCWKYLRLETRSVAGKGVLFCTRMFLLFSAAAAGVSMEAVCMARRRPSPPPVSGAGLHDP